MRLYVKDPSSGQKIHLQLTARTRKDLANTIGGNTFSVQGSTFHVRNVMAEIGADSATVGAMVGAFIGVLGGAPGVIAGSALGALLGGNQAEQEKRQVDLFNRSEP